ncbi:MAG: hypothetical protein D9N14_04750 [Ketobacter sp.]|nr:MAG: hypothetical protein D9N14_04750 [Ketobacter sp.]
MVLARHACNEFVDTGSKIPNHQVPRIIRTTKILQLSRGKVRPLFTSRYTIGQENQVVIGIAALRTKIDAPVQISSGPNFRISLPRRPGHSFTPRQILSNFQIASHQRRSTRRPQSVHSTDQLVTLGPRHIDTSKWSHRFDDHRSLL